MAIMNTNTKTQLLLREQRAPLNAYSSQQLQRKERDKTKLHKSTTDNDTTSPTTSEKQLLHGILGKVTFCTDKIWLYDTWIKLDNVLDNVWCQGSSQLMAIAGIDRDLISPLYCRDSWIHLQLSHPYRIQSSLLQTIIFSPTDKRLKMFACNKR